MIEASSTTMCWPVEKNDTDQYIGRKVDEGNPPKNVEFYWAWSGDTSSSKLEDRFYPKKNLIGLSLGITIPIKIINIAWPKNWHDVNELHLIYTDEYGIIAARRNQVKILSHS